MQKVSDKQWAWMFRFAKKKWKKEIIQPVFKVKGITVIGWADFGQENKSDLYKFVKNLESKKIVYSANSYKEISENNILVIWHPILIFVKANILTDKAKKPMK